jgi:hypothetical protein
MTHRGMRSAAPAAAPGCRAAGTVGFLAARRHLALRLSRGRPPGVSAWPSRPRRMRRPGPVMNESRRKERPHACHLGLSLGVQVQLRQGR